MLGNANRQPEFSERSLSIAQTLSVDMQRCHPWPVVSSRSLSYVKAKEDVATQSLDQEPTEEYDFHGDTGTAFGAREQSRSSEVLADRKRGAMEVTQSPTRDKIQFFVGMSIRGPITRGDYNVGKAVVNVDYPPRIDLGFPTPIDMPKGRFTAFVVTWTDTSGSIARKLQSKGAERHLPIYDAIAIINELLLAFKLVRVGHADGDGVRTVGLSDTLFFFSKVNDVPMKDMNMRLRLSKAEYPWANSRSGDPYDSLATTPLAKPHIGMNTYPVARRYVRCFELLEHGFYTEALVVAFAILDDLVQQMLDDLLLSKGLAEESDRKELLRGIKEQRLKLYLGPLLKTVTGKAVEELWPQSPEALKWLNRKRNDATHAGAPIDYSAAAQAIYACIKTLVVLNKAGYVKVEFPVEMFRHAKVVAAWSDKPPEWVPTGGAAESFSFDD